MTEKELHRLLIMLSAAAHDASRLSDQLFAIAEALKDAEIPGWRGK